MRTPRALAGLALIAALAAACSGAAATASPIASTTPPPSVAPSTAVVSTAPSTAPSEAATPSPTANACAAANLTLKTAGKLTIGTDNPAYPPYYAPRAGGNTKPWSKDGGDPTTGEGFESAVAYAVAKQLGFTTDQVVWTVVPFNNSYQPGPKPFDFYLAQVSYTDARAKAVDMSDGYYFVAQSVVAMKGSALEKVTSIAGMKGFKFGAQVGTTAYDAIKNVIAPSTSPSVYNDNDAAIKALQAKQIDGLVVDLPTAFYITAVQVDHGKVLQFPAVEGGEHFGMVFAKGNPLAGCVNKALSTLEANGTLARIQQQWLAKATGAPVLK